MDIKTDSGSLSGRSRNRNTREKKGTVAAAVFSAVALVLALLSLTNLKLASDQRETASRQAQGSLQILQELTYTLPEQLTGVPEAYERIAGILTRNAEAIEAVIRLSGSDPETDFDAAANYEKLANMETMLGGYADALTAQQKAADLYRGLSDERVEGADRALASAWNNLGAILQAVGRNTDAEQIYDDAIRLYRGTTSQADLTLARMLFNAGANHADMGSGDRAERELRESLSLLSGLEETPEILEASANTTMNIGMLLYRKGDLAEAEKTLREAQSLYDRLLLSDGSEQARTARVKTVSALAAVLSDAGDLTGADSCYLQAVTLAEGRETDEDRRMLADILHNRAINLILLGDYSEADRVFADEAEIRLVLSEKTGLVEDRARYASALLHIGENAYRIPDYSRSEEYFKNGLSAFEGILNGLSGSGRAHYQSWMALYRLIHQRNPRGAVDAAMIGRTLAPNDVQVNRFLAYACLYGGYEEDAENILSQIAALGGGQRERIILDLEAQRQAGLVSAFRDRLLEEYLNRRD